MRRRALIGVFAVVAGCKGGPRLAEGTPGPRPRASAIPEASAPAKSPVRCVQDRDFPGVWRVAEASAAAEVELAPGAREVLVISDSGNRGEALLWGIPKGPFRALRLPLDPGASDDLEGAAWLSGRLYTLTSSGAVRRFRPDGRGGLARDGDAYRVGPPPASCPDLKETNCGPNYEGLCLRAPGGHARCAGYAASKAWGKLYCLVLDGDGGDPRLRVDLIKPPVDLGLAHHALSDCAFGAAGGPARDTLLVTTNVYGGSATYVVDEATFALTPLDVPGLPNNEAVAVDGDGALYQFMDSNSEPSLASRLTCQGWR